MSTYVVFKVISEEDDRERAVADARQLIWEEVVQPVEVKHFDAYGELQEAASQ